MSRDELRRALWAEDTFVHFDNGLNSCIKQVRAALGDTRTSPRYVETLVRRGYRFIAPVVIVPDADSRARRSWLRVLPVRLIDSDPAHAALADGLSEEIVAQFASAAPPEVAVTASAGDAGRDLPEPPADFLLTTSLRTAGESARVTAQLLDARTRCHVWAGRFDALLTRPLDAQASIAERIFHDVILLVAREDDEADHPGVSAAARPMVERG